MVLLWRVLDKIPMSQIDNVQFFSQIIVFLFAFLFFYIVFYVKLFPLIYRLFRIRVLESSRLFASLGSRVTFLKYLELVLVIFSVRLTCVYLGVANFYFIYTLMLSKYRVFSLLR